MQEEIKSRGVEGASVLAPARHGEVLTSSMEVTAALTTGTAPHGAATQTRGLGDIAHGDVSSYLRLIRVIMSPALIYVVIVSPQSCIDRS